MSSPENPDFLHYQNVLEDTVWNHRGDVDLYAQTLADRIHVEKEHAAFFRSRNTNMWGYANGSYQKPYKDDHGVRRLSITDPLSGIEQTLAQQINTRLLSRAVGDKPVVALDFGGGFALSLMRIGAHEDFKHPIENGELILAATNLGYLPPEAPDNDGYTGVARDLNMGSRQGYNTPAPAEKLDFAQGNQHRVQYLDSDLFTIGSQRVQMIDGKLLPLTSNVDVLNERMALTHSHIPDLAIGALAALLVAGGRFYLDTKNGHLLEPPTLRTVTLPDERILSLSDRHDTASIAYDRQRRAALDLGVEAAHHFGLKPIDQGDIYTPLTFRKQRQRTA